MGQTGSQSDSLPAFPPFSLPAPICLPVFKKSFIFFFGYPVTSLNAALMLKEKSSYSTFCSAPSPIFYYYYYFYLFACYFVREIPTAVAGDVAFPCCKFATRAPRFFQVNTAQSLSLSPSLSLSVSFLCVGSFLRPCKIMFYMLQ